MALKRIAKNFNNFRGRDTRSSDLVRDINSAIEFQNARVVAEDSCVSREGFHTVGDEGQCKGLYTYRYSDATSGETVEELISIGAELYRKKDTTFTISYAGAGTTVTFNHALNTTTSTYQVDIEVDSVNVFSQDVGTGNEVSTFDLADLKTAIELVAGFTCVISGATTVPAAFIPILLEDGFTAGAPDTYVITVYNWEQMSTLANADFSDYSTAYAQDYFELASTANVNNCLFIAHGYGYLYKYDGQNVYRAGMPVASTDPSVSIGGTGFTDTSIKYIYHYKQVDNRGNEILGVESDASNIVSPANNTVTITVANVLAASEFNTGCAIVNGLQAGVTTITVDAAHTFKIGDTAYFYDGVSATYVERPITSVGATTITISGGAVNVADNAVISNNLRIVIYRTTNSGSLFYKVAEIPNDSFNATQNYADALAIASLGTQYVIPIRDRDPLDIFPKYLTVHQDLLVAAGDPEFPNTWYYSSGEGPEYFPALSNYEDIRSTSGGGIKGLGSDQEFLVIGTERNLFVFSGDLASGSGRLEKINEGHMGFASHNSIVDIGRGILFLGRSGFWLIQNGYNLLEVGEPINSDFTNIDGYSDAQIPIIKRATAIHFDETDEYVCFIPAESSSGSARYSNGNSVAHVFNIDRNAWGTWTGLNMGGGVTSFENNVFFQSNRDDPSLTVTGNLWRRNAEGRLEDYADHENAIDFRLGTQWMDDGEPSVFKVFLWIKVYNLLRSLLAATFTLTVSVERDFRRNVPWFMFDLDFGAGTSSVGWGYAPWGEFVWGTPVTDSNKMKLKSGKAQSLRYVFSNSVLNQKVAISAWETETTAPYVTAIKD